MLLRERSAKYEMENGEAKCSGGGEAAVDALDVFELL
jgi:hypothetical protein